jgi:uncharacterized protein YjbI with pentapeptide repeats
VRDSARESVMAELAYVALAVVVAVGAFAVAVSVLGWDWTGLTEKTLWDWLQLLVIPLALVAVGFVLSSLQSEREQRREEQRTERAQRREARQAARDREIAADNRREEALRGYLQEMSDLMLEGRLLRGRRSSDARLVARTLTLTVLRRLDGQRKAAVARFLTEAHLLEQGLGRRPRIDLAGADFRGVELGAGSFGAVPVDGVVGGGVLASFSGADLRGAVFRNATMVSTRFENARLAEADFGGATLVEVDFRGADLTGANLRGARTQFLETSFDYADLQDADLREVELLASFDGASLENADFAEAQLAQLPGGGSGLRGSFTEACLTGARFVGASARNADFTFAYGHGADFTGADLRDTDFRNAQLPEARFEGAMTERAKLPSATVQMSRRDMERRCQAPGSAARP